MLLKAVQSCEVCDLSPFRLYRILFFFDVPLFIMVITGKTSLPQWACVINTLPLMIVLLPTKLPAKGNIAGAFMFLGLFFILR